MVSKIADPGGDDNAIPAHRVSVNSNSSSTSVSGTVTKAKKYNFFRPASLIKSYKARRASSESSADNDEKDIPSFSPPQSYSVDSCSSVSTDSSINSEGRVKHKKRWDTIVTIVLVEAKGLPNTPQDGSTHTTYCKFRLGSQSVKSKSVINNRQPQWGERLKIKLYADPILNVTLWDQGKQKNIMGSCFIDLSGLEKERTHELWAQLEDGFGMVHLAITLCQIRKSSHVNNSTTNETYKTQEEDTWRNLKSDWSIVGQLNVKVICARGLNGKPNAYCTLELDNQRILTPTVRSSPEAVWNKSYTFNIRDISSVLDLRLYDTSLVNSIRNDSIGKVSIPLLRIKDGAKTWYALKDRNRRNIARGNCSRVLLEISMVWNPVKAAVRLFRPKEVKYVKKPSKFDVALIYSNTLFIRDSFNSLQRLNEQYKSLFEWEDRELSFLGVVLWLLFWYYLKLWAVPLLLLVPFSYFWIIHRSEQSNSKHKNHMRDDVSQNTDTIDSVIKNPVTKKVKDLPELTLTITQGVEYMVSSAERLYNLVSFKVPFLSYLSIIFLLIASVVLYTVPFNYIMIGFGLHKYLRKCINPNRVLNNDLIEFISRVPDNETLKDWKEFNVPEPNDNNKN